MSFNKKHVDCFIIRAETKFHGWSFYRIMRPLGEREGIQYQYNTLSAFQYMYLSDIIKTSSTYIWIILTDLINLMDWCCC